MLNSLFDSPILGVSEELNVELVAGLRQVEVRLLESIRNADALADTTSRYLVEAGGKRVRPFLALLVSRLGVPVMSKVVDACVVIELTHLATLYHDDVMDSAFVRRGVPTANQVWGNSVAVLTGDLLFSKASLLVAGLGSRALEIQAETFERLCLGQLHETLGPGEGEDPLEHYFQVLADKTGSLIVAAVRFGALFSGVSDVFVEVLVSYAQKLGVAFQLADDVLDVVASGSELGKMPGADLREGVATLPVLLLRAEVAAGDCSVETLRVLGLVEADLSSDAALALAVAALGAHPVLDRAWQVAKDWSVQAVESLVGLPEGAVKDALLAFAEVAVSRSV